MDLTNAAKPRCLDLEGYTERYSHIDQFSTRPSGSMTNIQASLLADLRLVEVEPMISAETADELKEFLRQKLAIVKVWIHTGRRGRNYE